jgi:ribose 5-phosphate isomerase A
MPEEKPELSAVAAAAVERVGDGEVIGLGTGHAAGAFLRVLADRVKAGLRVRGVATSDRSAELAARLGIPLTTLDDVPELDAAFDGADEVDPRLDLIKGYGGALVREKVIAASARRLVILVGQEKLVPVLGTRGRLPVEVVPIAVPLCRRRLRDLGCDPVLRAADGRAYTSDNGNHILDCRIGPLADPPALERALRAIPGVVGTGLFLGMARTVLVGTPTGVEVRERDGG